MKLVVFDCDGTIVDSGANLKAFFRMDDAWVGSIDIAIKKAKTAVFFGMPTGEIGKLSQPGKSLYGIEHSNEGLITFPGGLPIVDEEGVLVGAIGVSGSSVENDHAVAEASCHDRRTSTAASFRFAFASLRWFVISQTISFLFRGS